MNCAICKRRIADCSCQKKQALTEGRWPAGTWFQRRLKTVRVREVLKKASAQQSGRAGAELVLFLGMVAAIIGGIFLLSTVLDAAFNLWQGAARCIEALLECRNL